MNYGGTCREEIVWDAREFLQSQAVSWKTEKGSWRRTAILARSIDIDHSSLKQPEVTYLWLGEHDDELNESRSICRRPCCSMLFPEVMDAVVGPVVVALSEDRYSGDWWRTSHEEAFPKNKGEFRWYGTDNFFLRHPVLTSLVMGMFRQGILLFSQGFDDAILRAVNRKEVEECLTNGDSALAMKLLKQLRPWLETPTRLGNQNFSFPAGYWDRLALLSKAISTYGYDELFDGNIQKSWNINAPQEDEDDPTWGGNIINGRYEVPNGPLAYWGTTGNKVTPAGKRLAKLGK